MYKSLLKVFGEYLIPKTALAASIAGSNVVRMGRSMSGLEIVVCAEGTTADPENGSITVPVGASVTIKAKHSQDGVTFIALPEFKATMAAATTFTPGEIIARMTIPYDCMPYVKADLAYTVEASGTLPAGNVSVFPAYLPR
jgi:hypothetical protein